MGYKATYDPKAVVVTWNGITIQGYSDGTHIESDRTEDAFAMKAGNDGEVVRTMNNNRTGRVTVRLLQSSITNDLLSAAAQQDEIFGDQVGPLQIEDLRGTTLETAQNAWLVRLPQSQWAKEAGEREWAFDCDFLDRFVGGQG
jgi:hypothetical protein